jgi:hypothetical protein
LSIVQFYEGRGTTLKASKDDLHPPKRPSEIIYMGIIVGYSIFLVLLPILWLYPKAPTWAWAVPIIGLALGVVLSIMRRFLPTHLDFTKAYDSYVKVLSLGKFLVPIFVIYLISLGVLYLVVRNHPIVEGLVDYSPVQLVPSGVFLFSIAVILRYFGDIFEVDRLVMLCCRQAQDTLKPLDKLGWTLAAVYWTEQYAYSQGVQLATDTFCRNIVIEILEERPIEGTLSEMIEAVSAGTLPISTIRKSTIEGNYEFVQLSRTLRERVNDNLRGASDYSQNLGAILAVLISIVTLVSLILRK